MYTYVIWGTLFSDCNIRRKYFYLNLHLVVLFKGNHPTHDDDGQTINDIEKRFIAFNCQLKKLNRQILLSWFDIRFTGYKPEFNFLVGSNLDEPKFFFLKISRKGKLLYLFILISRLSTHLLLELYFWWIPGRKKRVSICFSNFILKIPI